MSDPQKCPQCGAPLAADVPGGLCLRCLLGLGLKSGDPDPADENPAASVVDDEFPGYDVLEKIGEGGGGIVYRAAQTEPVRREVAIKVIKLGMDTRAVITRFEAERQVLALMDHPGIARVFDAGVTGRGRPFFVMELVSGEPITDYCDRKQLSVPQRLDLFLSVCEAVRHAHLKGIIHRDLKPSNILVAETDGKPSPKVIDFGVAKAMDCQRLADQTIYTAFDQFVGTPAYMSPEQAGLTGEDIDARSDIYSLGVLLYELLTGRPPFEPARLRQAAIHEICRIIREEDPSLPSARLTTLGEADLTAAAHQRLRPPKRLVGELRGDLDGIVMKALEKSRERRYETTAELAADITRHLRHEPVTARAPGALYRFRKFARRNKLAITAASMVLVSLTGGLAVSSWMYLKEKRSRQHLERRAYLSDMNQAVRMSSLRIGGLAGTVRLLETWRHHQPDLRDWEWYYLNGLCRHERLSIPVGAGEPGSVDWSPDGQQLAVGTSDGSVKIIDPASGRTTDVLSGHTGEVRATVWSADGTRIASAGEDNTLRIWDVAARAAKVIDETATSPAWSPDGKWLAAASPDGSVKLRDAATLETARVLPTGAPVRAVCWNGDGSRLFACGAGGQTLAWDAATGAQLWKTLVANTVIIAADCSPDGRELVTGGMDNAVNFLNADTGENLVSLFDNQNAVLSLVWSPDGTRIVTSTRSDGRIALRDATAGGRVIHNFRGHLGSVRAVAWRPDGTQFASASTDGTVRIWDANAPNPSVIRLKQPDQARALAWSPDGTQLAVGSRRSDAWIRDFTMGGAPIALPGGFTSWSRAVGWNPAGTRLASGGTHGLKLWDIASRTVVWQDTDSLENIRSLAWWPDGSKIIAANSERQLVVWDAATGQPLRTLDPPPGETGAVAVSPDGQTIACRAGAAIHLCNQDLKTRKILTGHRESVNQLAWSPDGNHLASCSDDGSAKIWDAHEGTLLQTLDGHGAAVFTVAWDPAGTRLATGSWDLTVRIWDPLSGTEICAFDQPAGIVQMIYAVAWNPDGRRIAVGDVEGRIGILDASPGWSAETGTRQEFPAVPRDTAADETRRSLKHYCRTVEPHAANDPDSLRRLAWILATAPYDDVRDGPKSLQFASQANQICGGRNPGILAILAAAHAECGDFDKAIATQQKAISLLRKGGDAQAPYAAALKLYESHQPFRDDSW
jgi:eukaryotic-like serine/threonine-protein kinase